MSIENKRLKFVEKENCVLTGDDTVTHNIGYSVRTNLFSVLNCPHNEMKLKRNRLKNVSILF